MFPARVLFTISILTFLSFSLASVVSAWSSSSTSYRMEGEFGNFGGSKSSASYTLTDTGGGFAVTFSQSSNYRNCSGFQCVIAEIPTITATLSTGSVNLGTLSNGAVNTASHTINVKTNYAGYTTRVYEDGNLRTSIGATISDVGGDNQVNAGSEEYGIATSEAGNTVVQDTNCSASTFSASAIEGISNSKSVASHAGPTQFTYGNGGETTTLCYAASISPLTAAGSYQHQVIFVTTGNF